MSDISIDKLFSKDRFPSITWNKILFLLVYIPIGLLLSMIRICMVLQVYVAATLLRSQVSVRRFILRVVCIVLGISIEEDKSVCKRNTTVRFLISNHVSLFDHIAIHILTNCISFVHCDIPDWILNGIGLKNVSLAAGSSLENVRLSVLRSELPKHEEPILILPEEETTNGQVGLLKFNNWWASEVESVQPVALYLRRPSVIDIKPSILGSSWYSDYFWSFFVPFTIYTIKYLPVIEKDVDESNENFADRVQAAIADNMNLVKTKFTNFDKKEYEKRYMKEKRRALILNQQNIAMRNRRELQKMASQVAEVLPHIARDTIMRDLENTRNVDVTITNILEGRVPSGSIRLSVNRNISLQTAAGTSSADSQHDKITTSSKNISQQYMTFQERKATLIEEARRKYKEKHNL